MGYISHHAIVVTSFDDKIQEPHIVAKQIIGNELISDIIDSPINGYKSFFVAPDGSKEGWNESEEYEDKRDMFIKWLQDYALCYWALIQYGDDNGENVILKCS